MKKEQKKTIVQLLDASSEDNLKLANRLAGLGWRVHIISHKHPVKGFDLHQGLSIHRLVVSPVYPLTYAAFLFAAPLIILINPDVVHAHYLTRFGILAAVYRRFLRFDSMVLTACGPDVMEEAVGGLTRWSAKHALKMFERITCPTNDLKKALLALEAPAGRIETIDWVAGKTESAADQLDAIYIDLIDRRRSKRVSS